LEDEYNVSYLLIAYNLATVRYMAQQTAVMYLGQIVEYSDTEDLYQNPLHPYAKALFSAALPSHPDLIQEEITLRGEVPSPITPPPQQVVDSIRGARLPWKNALRKYRYNKKLLLATK